ncbi:hypothetical protein AB0J35_18705 [Nonomuraea angiospora]|uniref:sodium:solute symporter family transporter n=1 Tax=Nonomuraea angiospora TaxID=46172 RepID=UPI00341564C7
MRIGAGVVDYALILVYFAVVLLVGVAARRRVSSSLDFLLSGRSLPAWITGLAFISANLGAVEIIGMSANGAEYGMPTMHYYWIDAVPAMLFLGIVFGLGFVLSFGYWTTNFVEVQRAMATRSMTAARSTRSSRPSRRCSSRSSWSSPA